MKKGKSRNKRKKTRSRLLWIAIAVIGIAAVISAVCVAGMLATKENAWKTPEELLVEYMDHIPKQEYEEMYAITLTWTASSTGQMKQHTPMACQGLQYGVLVRKI